MSVVLSPVQLADIEPSNVSAMGIPIRVVAVKWPGHWIVRGIVCFGRFEAIAARVRPYVLLAPQDELEWTQHSYLLPHYLAYGEGDLPRIGWPSQGVFLFAHQGGDNYKAPARRLDTP